MPLGTAHETPTPSFSSRKSQCNRRAWCSWTTNRGALVSLRGTVAPGSGVRLKSRLASYSASLRATMKRLGHGRFLLVNRHRGFPRPRWRTEPRRQARAPPARPSGGCECWSLLSLLREAHLETDPLRADLASLEWAVRCEAFELRGRVGAALEHLERRLRRERADSPEVHLVDLALDVGVGCVPTHVLDHRRPTGAKDAVNLGERAMGQREIFERRLADDQVEGVRFKRHLGHVPLAEFDGHPDVACVFGCDLDERAADVEAGHLEPSRARHLDRQVSRAGGNFEHPGAVSQSGGELESLLPVRLELALRAPHARVPPRNRALHLGTLETPASGLGHLHVAPPHLTVLGAYERYNTPNSVRNASGPTRHRGESSP